MAGEVEGVVSSLGLFYTTLVSGGDRTMIPNNVIMMLAVIPISEPERVELKATFNADVTPQKLQRMIEKAVTIPLRNQPHVRLEELSGDEVTVTIVAVPLNTADGPKLASDVLEAVRDSDLDGTPDAYDLPTPTGDHDDDRGRRRSGRARGPDRTSCGAARDRRSRAATQAPAITAEPAIGRFIQAVRSIPSRPTSAARERRGVAGVDRGAEQRRLAQPRRIVADEQAVHAERDVAAAGQPGQRDRTCRRARRSRGPGAPGGSGRARRSRSRSAPPRSRSRRRGRAVGSGVGGLRRRRSSLRKYLIGKRALIGIAVGLRPPSSAPWSWSPRSPAIAAVVGGSDQAATGGDARPPSQPTADPRARPLGDRASRGDRSEPGAAGRHRRHQAGRAGAPPTEFAAGREGRVAFAVVGAGRHRPRPRRARARSSRRASSRR